jgi:hypothetical protein
VIAGWLFADCMLGLMLIGLASDPGTAGAEAVARHSTSITTTAPTTTAHLPTSARPTRTKKAVTVPAVDRRAYVQDFQIRGRSDAVIVADMRRRYSGIAQSRRGAAFVLSFGTASQPGDGVQLAARTNALLTRSSPAIFAGAARRDFWRGTGTGAPRDGVVRVEVYLFSPAH